VNNPAFGTVVSSPCRRSAALAFTDFGVESLIELIKIHIESEPHKER
jgi:hypothetical protein